MSLIQFSSFGPQVKAGICPVDCVEDFLKDSRVQMMNQVHGVQIVEIPLPEDVSGPGDVSGPVGVPPLKQAPTLRGVPPLKEAPVPWKAAPEADALITRVKGLKLVVRTADCIPLVMADSNGYGIGIVAAVHAGWRGLTANIIPLTLARLKEMGVELSHLKVGVGPSLGVECAVFAHPYQEIPEKYHWAIREEQVQTRPRRVVDLNAIARSQLLGGGVQEKNIEWLPICTQCNQEWPSWRRDQTPDRFYTFIELALPLC